MPEEEATGENNNRSMRSAYKKQIKASITAAIAKEVMGSDSSEIAQKVEDVYEGLLVGAVVFAHIPSLTAGAG